MTEPIRGSAIEAAATITVTHERRQTAYWRLIEHDDMLTVAIAPKDGDPPAVISVATDAPVSELLDRLRSDGGTLSSALFGSAPEELAAAREA